MNHLLERWFSTNSERMTALSDRLWQHPEFSEQEEYAAAQLMNVLREAGFTLETGVGGLPTAFSAAWGTGAPRIGLLAEYDALPGLAQAAVPKPSPLPEQPCGHGCGHNLLGTGAVVAGLALKTAMDTIHLPGTVVVYGCPSEEIMVGKIAMTGQHVFDDLDVALFWHPGDLNRASELSYQAMLSLDYTSHAAMAPQEGLSALDAVELMNVGANYLREHIPPGGQLHYVITNGGEKPNIVPERAAVWYFIRAASSSDVARIRARLDDIARGAALMTGAKVSSAVRTGCNETRIVPALASILNDVMCREMAAPYWSAEEKDFSSALVFGLGMDKAALRADYGTDVGERPLHDGVEPLTGKTIHITGSSDLSDVSWVVPTGMLFSACYPKGIPNHTLAVTACSGMSIGHKGMLYAAQVLAAAGLRLVSDPALMEEVKTSFRICMGNDHYQAAVAR
jgi:aminobenzoyl-glutamate utilization protein B